jgi:hypothetical protein
VRFEARDEVVGQAQHALTRARSAA